MFTWRLPYVLSLFCFFLVSGRAQVPYSYCMHFAKCFRARNIQLSRLGGSCVCCFSVSVLQFLTSPNSGVKLYGGFLKVGKLDFTNYFCWLCLFFLVFLFLPCDQATKLLCYWSKRVPRKRGATPRAHIYAFVVDVPCSSALQYFGAVCSDGEEK